MTIFKKIYHWAKKRNIYATGYDLKSEVRKDIEETFEMMGLEKDKVEYNTEIFVKHCESTNLFEQVVSEDEKIDAHCDKIVFAINAIEALGYDAEKCMEETYMEINSREQDPEQKKIWEQWSACGKWKKWQEQPEETLYKANYSRCLRSER